jgi:hypothetical protein
MSEQAPVRRLRVVQIMRKKEECWLVCEDGNAYHFAALGEDSDLAVFLEIAAAASPFVDNSRV